MTNSNFKPSYYNRTQLQKQFTIIKNDFINNNNASDILITNFFEQLIKIPSSKNIALCNQVDPNLLKFVWINKKNITSVWNIQFCYHQFQFLKISVDIIKNGKTEKINFTFSNTSEFPFKLFKDLAISFYLEDIKNPKIWKNMYISNEILEMTKNNNDDIYFDLFNNSCLNKKKNKIINKIKNTSVIYSYIFVFDYYDGPLTGIHMIDNKLYYFFMVDYLDLWHFSPELISLVEVPEHFSIIIKSWLELTSNSENYLKKLALSHESDHINLNILFADNPTELSKATIILNDIILEHTNILNDKKPNFYLLL